VDTTITTLEFCAGYGGIGLGLKNIFGERMRTIAYCELEGYAQANLISKMEKGLMDVAPLWNDLKTFPYESFHGLVDILIAGYPCQPFSAAGKRAGKEDPRHLWPWIADGIRLLQPRMCFFENVEGHISLGLREVVGELEQIGYQTAFGIFSAREVGAPHQRKRVFIMAHRKHARLEGFCEFRSPISWTDKGSQSWDGGSGEELAHRSDEGLQGRKWFWQAGAQGASNRHSTECSSSMADSTNWRGEGLHDWNTKPEDALPCCAWPSRPGQPQYAWEPPRVVGNSKCFRLESTRDDGAMEKEGSSSSGERSESSYATKKSSNSSISVSKIEPEVGRDAHGNTNGVDISKLSSLCDSELAEIYEWMVKSDNRTDELRSCGNGVVPATAERAFRTLLEELINK